MCTSLFPPLCHWDWFMFSFDNYWSSLEEEALVCLTVSEVQPGGPTVLKKCQDRHSIGKDMAEDSICSQRPRAWEELQGVVRDRRPLTRTHPQEMSCGPPSTVPSLDRLCLSSASELNIEPHLILSGKSDSPEGGVSLVTEMPWSSSTGHHRYSHHHWYFAHVPMCVCTYTYINMHTHHHTCTLSHTHTEKLT